MTYYAPEKALSTLALHGLTIATAREQNVSFVCLGCGSVAAVTPSRVSSRTEQRDLIQYSCCGETVKI